MKLRALERNPRIVAEFVRNQTLTFPSECLTIFINCFLYNCCERASEHQRPEEWPRTDSTQSAEAARAFAEAQWSIVAEYEDRESGTKGVKDRPQFSDMMQAASRREFDIVLVWSLDRFSREGIGKTFDHLKRLDKYGVKFRSYGKLPGHYG